MQDFVHQPYEPQEPWPGRTYNVIGTLRGVGGGGVGGLNAHNKDLIRT